MAAATHVFDRAAPAGAAAALVAAALALVAAALGASGCASAALDHTHAGCATPAAACAAPADLGSAAHATPDLARAPDGGCVPEPDQDFCDHLGKSCELVTGTDNCNLPRTASCGTCSGALPACVDNVCRVPVCGTSFASAGTVVASVSTATAQEVLLGASASGGSILYLRATSSCVGGGATLFIGDDPSGSLAFTSTDITALPSLAGFTRVEESMTLSADGLTIIGVVTGGRSFQASSRSAVGATDFAAPVTSAFDTLDAGVPAGGTLSWPVISADGLAFYYRVDGASDANADGIYESLRTATTAPFPAGIKLPATVQAYTAVSGLASDRMTAFVTVSFGTTLLTRDSLLSPFATPSPAPSPPGQAYRVVPIAGCARLIGTCEPGGCSHEDICVWTKQ